MRKMIYIDNEYNNLIKEKKINFSEWIRKKLEEEFSLDKNIIEKKIKKINEKIESLENQKNNLKNIIKNEVE